MTMLQTAPDPVELRELVETTTYRPGWSVWLEDRIRDRDSDGVVLARGLTLVIQTAGYNSYHIDQGQDYAVHHYMIVPAATYDRRSWRRWLFDQFLLVESHEAMEFFKIDGVRPYPPSHGPGNSPYLLRELGTELDQKTSFRGVVNP